MFAIKFLSPVTIFSMWIMFFQDPIGPFIDFKIPLQAKKISFAQYKVEKAKFSNKRVSLDFKSLYRVGDVLMGIEEGKYPLSYSVTLERLKDAGPELLRKKEKMIANEIIKINNIRILVRKCQSGEEYNYQFYSDFKHNSNVSGIVEFRKKDRQEAELIFDQLLKSIKMK